MTSSGILHSDDAPDVGRRRRSRWASVILMRTAEALALALAYYILARVGLQLQFAHSQATPVWPPSGLAFAGFLLWGYRAGGGVFLGALCANLVDFYVKAGGSEFIEINGLFQYLSEHRDHLAISTLIAVGNTLEGLAGYYLVCRFNSTMDIFNDIRRVILFCAVTPVMCAVSSTIGVTSLFLGGVLPAALLNPVWITWWLGDITGILILTPLVTTWWKLGRFRFDIGSVFASALVLAILFMFNQMTFNGWLEGLLLNRVAYLLFPMLLYITFRFSTETATAGIVVTSAIAVLGTIAGRGPFVREDQNESFIILQGFVSVVSITVLFLNAAIAERRRALDDALRAKGELEQRVEVRTAQLAETNESLQRSNHELERVARLKDEFIATVSHELRTPLTSIAASLELLNEITDANRSDTTNELIGIAQANSKRLAVLVNDILDIEKLEGGKVVFDMRRVDIGSLLERAIEANRPMAERRSVSVRFESSALHDVLADPDRLTQVATNLLSNAFKFSPPGAEVVVTSEDRGDSVRISVWDHGPGIPDEFKDRIFQKFAQADNSDTRQKTGTGLGLSIVKQIVLRLGGEVGYRDVPDGGTVFFVELPRLQEIDHADAGEGILPRAGGSSGAAAVCERVRVLHLGHDPDVRAAVAKALRADAIVASAATIEDARRALAAGNFDLAVVYLDVQGDSGADFLSHLHNRVGQAIPIIVYSAQGAKPRGAEQAQPALIKNCDSLDGLVAAVRKHIEDSRSRAVKEMEAA